MRSRVAATAIIFAAGFGSAGAELGIEVSSAQADNPNSQIILKDGKSYWLLARQFRTGGRLETSLLMQEMDCRSETTREVKTPDNYMALTPLAESRSQNAVVIGTNSLGEWSLLQLRADLSGVRRSVSLSGIGVIWTSASSRAGYFIGGTSQDKQPVLMYFSGDLKNRKTLNLINEHNGEVSSVFESKGRVFALFNDYRDRKNPDAAPSAELREYSASGDPVSRTPLMGMAAMGVALKDGGIAIGYLIGEQQFVEKRDARLATLWSTELHQHSGIVSDKGRLLEAGDHIAWVGANDNKLLVHRLTQDGKLVQTSVDTKTGMGMPTPDIYSTHSSGKNIHIRGTAGRAASPLPGKITAFCFTEKPNF